MGLARFVSEVQTAEAAAHLPSFIPYHTRQNVSESTPTSIYLVLVPWLRYWDLLLPWPSL